MIENLLWNDIKRHKILSLATVIFMAVSSLFISLAVVLFCGLLDSVNGLMERALTPDYLQMHAGEIQKEKIAEFADEHSEVLEWQVCNFLNLENGSIILGKSSLAGSTQDNGLCVQSEKFDFLLDLNNDFPVVDKGKVYVPVWYRSMYDLNIGDKMHIEGLSLVIAGFIRDSQMNSMMASSKRFLVCKEDYQLLKEKGSEEYLIEFLLSQNADTDLLAADYKNAQLYSNGPAVTKPLIRMMNALSDGIMILVILIVGIAILLISLLCINFITSIEVEKDKKEAGMLKALGIENRQIRKLYLSKYFVFSLAGSLIGLSGAGFLNNVLSRKLRELYGVSDKNFFSIVITIMACVLVQIVILLFIRRVFMKMEKIPALEALFSVKTQGVKKEKNQYLIIGAVASVCMFLTLIPQNLFSTFSSPKFVTYMGIGNAAIRMDVRQSENILKITDNLIEELNSDSDVEKFAAFRTVSCPAVLSDGKKVNLIVESGNHSVFPVNYAEGKQPEKDGEIALSWLQAQDLGIKSGDVINLFDDGSAKPFVVCGIYSDITNGGKTAKISNLSFEGNAEKKVMWSILYVTLKENVQTAKWMDKYARFGVDIVDIADYVQGTYGPTINQIKNVRFVAVGIALLIIFIVVILFMRLMIEKKRFSISLQKALGFNDGFISRKYFTDCFFRVIIGLAAGILAGNVLGEFICGQILKSFGAFGFDFVIRWEQLFVILMIIMLVSVAGIMAGSMDVKKIKAYECCLSRE